jgi:VIT1/CCC1 family predicted Fe2+/Mn2+ transporter
MARKTFLRELRQYLQDPKSRRTWSLAARDGIVATGGILLGFTGAGASDRTLLMAATAATVAGMLCAGGAEWSEAASDREAQLNAVAEEKAEVEQQRHVEETEVFHYYRAKGLSRDLAKRVAKELMTRSPIKAALESGHGILALTSQAEVWLTGIFAALAYLLGAGIPLALTFFLPMAIETRLIVAAVLLSLVVTSIVGARAGHMNVGTNVVRTVVIGVVTITVSYFVGELAF